MYRILGIAGICLLATASVKASEVCVACVEPAASYRCAVEQPSQKVNLGGGLAAQICTKVLQTNGSHSKCRAVELPPDAACDAPARTVTLADYQRANAPPSESTYEPGAHEIARRGVHDTWLCVTSMFKDC